MLKYVLEGISSLISYVVLIILYKILGWDIIIWYLYLAIGVSIFNGVNSTITSFMDRTQPDKGKYPILHKNGIALLIVECIFIQILINSGLEIVALLLGIYLFVYYLELSIQYKNKKFFDSEVARRIQDLQVEREKIVETNQDDYYAEVSDAKYVMIE